MVATPTRALDSAGKEGATWGPEVDATANAIFGLNGGLLENVSGANTITATLTHPTGFTSPPPRGFRCDLIPAANNTTAVTLDILINGASTGALSVRDRSGTLLSANALVAGRTQALIYDDTNGYYRFAT